MYRKPLIIKSIVNDKQEFYKQMGGVLIIYYFHMTHIKDTNKSKGSEIATKSATITVFSSGLPVILKTFHSMLCIHIKLL